MYQNPMLNSMHKKELKQKKKKMETEMEKSCTNSWEMLYMKKTKKNLRKRIDVKLVSNKKGYLKWRYGLYVTQNI